MGASLLALFLNLDACTLGFWTILIAHIMFCISLRRRHGKARIAGLDPRLEQAAMDLYADESQTFRRVTLPLVAPGIAGRRAARASRCPSTTSSSPTSTPATIDHLPDVRLGCRPSAASRRRSTSSGRRCSSSRCSPCSSAASSAGRRSAVGRGPPRSPHGRPRPWSTSAPCRSGWTAPRPTPRPALAGRTTADLAVVGGGYTGLWTALLAKERDPGRDVVLLEGRDVGLGGVAVATAASARPA